MSAFLNSDKSRRALLWSRSLTNQRLLSLLHPRLRELLSQQEPSRFALAHGEQEFDDEGDRALHMALSVYLPDDLMTKVDITSMAHGLETRSPFLDHKVVEFVARLPHSQKIQRGQTKRFLKRSLRRRLPKELLHRRKKGFAVPLASWFRGSLNDFLKNTLLSSEAKERELFVPGQVEKLLEEHEQKRWNHEGTLWSLLCLELWFQRSKQRLPQFQGLI